MKTDWQIQNEVTKILKENAFLNTSEIGVAVKNGIVLLYGEAASYSQKMLAVGLAKNISGINVVVDEIDINVFPSFGKSDFEIAERVINTLKTLKKNKAIKAERVKTVVENGFITLEGYVEPEYQKEIIKSAVEGLTNPLKVFCKLNIKPNKKVA